MIKIEFYPQGLAEFDVRMWLVNTIRLRFDSDGLQRPWTWRNSSIQRTQSYNIEMEETPP